MTDPAAKTHLEVSALLKSGDIGALEGAQRRLESFPTGADPYLGHPWISHAIDLASPKVIVWMLGQGAAIGYTPDDGYAALHSAIERTTPDKYEVIATLISEGADLNVQGINDWTPLHLAAIRDDWKAITMLLDAGADPNVKTRIDEYATAEEEARNLGHVRSADLIRDYGR